MSILNSAITPIVTYTLCTIKVPKGFIDNIDRARKPCLWRGNIPENRGGNLVAWPNVMKPKDKGGLGVINLSLQNDALLLKQLHKFYNKDDIPWVHLVWSKYYNNQVPHTCRESGSFWWRDVMRLSTVYRGIAKCTLGDGSTVTFWADLWFQSVLAVQYPRLYSFVKDEAISVKDMMLQMNLEEVFYLPLSAQAYEELLQLQEYLEQFDYDDMAQDTWSMIWGDKYSSRRFYAHAFSVSGVEAHAFFVLWKAQCTPRVKFFACLILVDRLNTKTM